MCYGPTYQQTNGRTQPLIESQRREKEWKQVRIHGSPSRVRVDMSSDGEGH